MRKPVASGVLCLLALCAMLAGACKQTQSEQNDLAAMRKDIDELKAQQREMLEQIRDLRGEPQPKLISPAKSEREFDTGLGDNASAMKGNARAKVAIIEFSDFQCTFCAQFVRETLPQLERDYVKTGKVRLAFHDLPLPVHPNAFRAAEAARCAGEQGKFWEAHDRFFANQQALNPNDWTQHAQGLQLDVPKFTHCLEGGKYDDQIHRDVEEGKGLGIDGTPAFLIGVPSSDGQKVHVSKVLLGAESYETFKEAIDGLLAAPKK
ncbi:MAG: hypothetical protein QOE33_1625 [Acidobacteriota bacterium]|nr:hypothetical protein [Acidobacteriota bacterium]